MYACVRAFPFGKIKYRCLYIAKSRSCSDLFLKLSEISNKKTHRNKMFGKRFHMDIVVQYVDLMLVQIAKFKIFFAEFFCYHSLVLSILYQFSSVRFFTKDPKETAYSLLKDRIANSIYTARVWFIHSHLDGDGTYLTICG